MMSLLQFLHIIIIMMNFLVELTMGYLPWKSMQDKDEVGRCKQLCRKDEYIKELFGGCPREYITIMRLIDSIRLHLSFKDIQYSNSNTSHKSA